MAVMLQLLLMKMLWKNIINDMPVDIDAFLRGETAIVGKDNEQFAPNAALVGKTLTLTADSRDGKATDFLISGAFSFDDYSDSLSEGIDRRRNIEIVPDIIFVSEAGMERLTKEAVISGIGVDIKDMSQLEWIDRELQAVNGTLTTSEWEYNSTVGKLEEFDQMFYSVNLLGNGAAILLIVLGLLNFVKRSLNGCMILKTEKTGKICGDGQSIAVSFPEGLHMEGRM